MYEDLFRTQICSIVSAGLSIGHLQFGTPQNVRIVPYLLLLKDELTTLENEYLFATAKSKKYSLSSNQARWKAIPEIETSFFSHSEKSYIIVCKIDIKLSNRCYTIGFRNKWGTVWSIWNKSRPEMKGTQCPYVLVCSAAWSCHKKM